ncbi:MAG: hypothetical protein ABIZ81_06100 [Opitutaceae bacterium]
MVYFCTYCDQGYAARLLCLHQSLQETGEPFRLLVLCFDSAMEKVVAAAGHASLVAIPLTEVLAADPAYAAVRGQRTRVEFYFTATPVFVRHCLARELAADRMTYLDADLFFFGPISAVFAEQGDASVAIVPHRFPSRLKHLEKNGIYNVAWVSFRRDANGLACLAWWRERCLEWCHDFVDRGRYADQGYLDEFPWRFAGVKVLHHPGIDLAPWNVDGAALTHREGKLQVDGRPLIFYHFQGLRELLRGWFDPGLLFYSSTMTAELRHFVYQPYLQKLMLWQERLERDHGIVPRRGYHRLTAGNSWSDRWTRFAARWLLPVYRLLRRQLVHAKAPAVLGGEP